MPAKLALSALVGIFGGSSYLGVISEWAAIKYAIVHGFRAPVEGVPLLKATVTLGSFIALCSAAILFIASFMFFRILANRIEGQFRNENSDPNINRDPIEIFRELPLSRFWKVLTQSLLFIFMITLLISLAMYLYERQFLLMNSIKIAASLIIGPAVLFSALRWPSFSWWAGGITAFIVLVGGPMLMLNNEFYASFLQRTGFGGGIETSITENNSNDNNKGKTVTTGGLLLRTALSFFLYDPEKKQIFEIPINSVESINHPSIPLENRKVFSPPQYPLISPN